MLISSFASDIAADLQAPRQHADGASKKKRRAPLTVYPTFVFFCSKQAITHEANCPPRGSAQRHSTDNLAAATSPERHTSARAARKGERPGRRPLWINVLSIMNKQPAGGHVTSTGQVLGAIAGNGKVLSWISTVVVAASGSGWREVGGGRLVWVGVGGGWWVAWAILAAGGCPVGTAALAGIVTVHIVATVHSPRREDCRTCWHSYSAHSCDSPQPTSRRLPHLLA